jgi:predicted permease
MSSLLAEIRYALRALAAQPSWTIASLLCLAIGTGANTATFAVINGVLLRPLPFDEPRQIVMMAVRWSRDQQAGPVSMEQFRDLREANLPFQQMSLRTFLPVGMALEGRARMVQAEFVGGEYFELLRVRPFLGRMLSAEVDRAGAPLEAVISDKLWKAQFNSDPSTVGRAVRINGRAVMVRGVAPAGFAGAMRIIAADLWLPAAAYGMFASPEAPREAETRRVFGIIGRMKDGVSLAQVRQQTDTTLANLGRSRNGEESDVPVALIDEATGFGVPPGVKSAAMGGSAMLFTLMAMLVGVAVANVAGLMLARATGRQKETAVRLALGASRYQIVRQVFTESLILGFGGAILGGLIAIALPSLITGLGPSLPEHLTFAVDIRPDLRTGVYSTLAAIAIAGLLGLAPARDAAQTSLNLALREATGNTRTRGTSRSLHAFVIGQIAVSTVLLVVAILLGRSYLNMQSVDPGIDIHNTLAIGLDWSQTGADQAKGRAFYEQLLGRVASLPGVQSAALTKVPPLSPVGVNISVSVDGLSAFTAGATSVTNTYFDVVRLPILSGRAFAPTDTGLHPVAIINETMAKQIAAEGSPLGHHLAAGPQSRRLAVIGVVKDAKYRSLSESPKPVFYEPFAQTYSPEMTLLIRSSADPRMLIEPVRREIALQNSDLAAISIRTLEDQFAESAAPSRQRALILGVTCGCGLLLSALGLFGTMSYGVRLRVRELGVRMAVGAQRLDIAVMVLRQSLQLAAIGAAIGLLLALGASRLLTSTLFGVSVSDPLTMALVVGLLAGVAVAAAFLPARWAMNVDPVRSIRAD